MERAEMGTGASGMFFQKIFRFIAARDAGLEIEGETALVNDVAAALQQALNICDSLNFAENPYAAGSLDSFTDVADARDDLDDITATDKALFSAYLKSLDKDTAEALQDAYDEKIDTLEGVENLVELADVILESYNIFTNAPNC